MNRREFNTALAALAVTPPFAGAQAQQAAFSRQSVVDLAEDLAARPYREPKTLPEGFPPLGYDQYGDIIFQRESAPFGRDPADIFGIDLMHAGYNFPHPVDLFLVEDGRAAPIVYRNEMFEYGPGWPGEFPEDGSDAFSGFRLRAPMENPEGRQEFVVFQGASYFRSRGRGDQYGLSARGLAIDSGLPKPEEFPLFTAFWIEKPEPGDDTATVHALLESRRVTGAYTFRIRPGDWTIMDAEAALFPRAQIEHYGIAPLTSMFVFDATNRGRFKDFRWSVHDTHVLALETKDREWLLRPLANPPKKVEFSRLGDEQPRGFGLQQRIREFDQYQDLEAHYELRTSLWIEPRGDWGEGAIELIELPSLYEFVDNIVAYWRPEEALEPGRRADFAYRMRWGPPVTDPDLATVTATRIGLTVNQKRHSFVIDFDLPDRLKGETGNIITQGSVSDGTMIGVSGRLNHVTGGYRMSFELEPGASETIDLTGRLVLHNRNVSEIWTYRLFRG